MVTWKSREPDVTDFLALLFWVSFTEGTKGQEVIGWPEKTLKFPVLEPA